MQWSIRFPIFSLHTPNYVRNGLNYLNATDYLGEIHQRRAHEPSHMGLEWYVHGHDDLNNIHATWKGTLRYDCHHIKTKATENLGLESSIFVVFLPKTSLTRSGKILVIIYTRRKMP